MKPEWDKYKICGSIGDRSFREFSGVYHTSHVGNALSIIEAGAIKPTLVFDESKLNTKRILVAWLSPNHWGADGYRYGNIRFQIDFHELFRGKYFYWVEDKAYQIPACRILVTDKKRDSFGLKVYDPFKKGGPWWYDKSCNKHFYNNKFCLEFMFENAISLDYVEKVDFVSHHSKYCSVNRFAPETCKECRFDPSDGGAHFFARAVATGVDLSTFSSSFIVNGSPSTSFVEWPFHRIIESVSKDVEFSGNIMHGSDKGEVIAKSILFSFGYHRKSEARILADLFDNEDELIKALAEVICECISIDGWQRLAERAIGEINEG